MKVKNMQTPSGNVAKNQYVIWSKSKSEEQVAYDTVTFQSYNSVIARKIGLGNGYQIELDETYWNYSSTTAKYRRLFLNEGVEATRAKIKSGEYKLVNLN